MGSSIQAEIIARLNEAPSARCLAFYRADEPVHWLSREDVHRAAAGAAQQLVRHGVTPGDVCLIVLPSGEAAATALLATLLLGAVPLLVAPPTLQGANGDLYETLRHTLRRTKPRLVVGSASLASQWPNLDQRAAATRFVVAPFASSPQGNDAPLRFVMPRPTDVAAMQLTSGTTATSRICVWDQHAVVAAVEGMTAAMAVSSRDVCFNWTPLYHDMGLVNNLLLCLMRGVPLVLLSPHEFIRRPTVWLQGLYQTRATMTWSPNFGFAVAARKADDDALGGVRLDHVRAFWNAAERVHLETLETFYRRFAALGVTWDALKTNYGCAENVGGATFSALNEAPRHEHVDRLLLDGRGIARATGKGRPRVRIVSVGRPHSGLTVRILSPRGRALPDGEVGEIGLETPSRMRRYHRDARGTARAIRESLLYTGDLGYLRDGELFWVGRLRERITVHGKKIDPSAFEAVLASTSGLREGCFATFGVPDDALGTERVVVVSEVRLPPARGLPRIVQAIRRGCFLRLGVAVDDVVLVAPGTLAKTSSGKQRHRHVRRLYLEGRLEPLRLASSSVPAGSSRRSLTRERSAPSL